MARILSGVEIARVMDEETSSLVAKLRADGVVPTLALVRAGERADALQYERSVTACCRRVGVEARPFIFPGDADQSELRCAVSGLSGDVGVHGVLVLQPLPAGFDMAAVTSALDPLKDVDGATPSSFAGVYAGRALGWPPAVASACIELLSHYEIPCEGKRAVVIGQGTTVGLPISLMLLSAHATPTFCHVKSVDVPSLTREADIVVLATGCAGSFGTDFFRAGQTVIDVGAGWSEEKGRVCGDAAFDEVEPVVAAVSPVPGGVGAITASIVANRAAQVAGGLGSL